MGLADAVNCYLHEKTYSWLYWKQLQLDKQHVCQIVGSECVQQQQLCQVSSFKVCTSGVSHQLSGSAKPTQYLSACPYLLVSKWYSGI